MGVLINLIFMLLVATVRISEVAGCTSNVECPQDQCCGSLTPDILGLLQSCQPFSQHGEACHGSLIGASCDCAPGLICVEHTGLLSFLHTSKGICRAEGEATNEGIIFGK